jgi:hydrogenase maturation protease
MIYIIAYGNPMRADDGFAWKAAGFLNPESPDYRLHIVYQLGPELAEELSQASGVIFLDARRGETPGEVICEKVTPDQVVSTFTHSLTPAMLLAYARGLYGKYPPAYLVSVTGENWGFSTELTPAVSHSIPAALEQVQTSLRKLMR